MAADDDRPIPGRVIPGVTRAPLEGRVGDSAGVRRPVALAAQHCDTGDTHRCALLEGRLAAQPLDLQSRDQVTTRDYAQSMQFTDIE